MNYTIILLALIGIFVNANDALQDNCWASKFDMKCCPLGEKTVYTDEDGEWGIFNNEWCGIVNSSTILSGSKTVPTNPMGNVTYRPIPPYMTLVNNQIVTTLSAGYYDGPGTFTLPINVADALIRCMPAKGIQSNQGYAQGFNCVNGECYKSYSRLQGGITPCELLTKSYPTAVTNCADTFVATEYAPNYVYSSYYEDKSFKSTYVITDFTSGTEYIDLCTTYSMTGLFDTTTYFKMNCQEKTTTGIPVVRTKTTTGYQSSCVTEMSTSKSLEDLRWTTKVHYVLVPSTTICDSSLVTSLTYSIETIPGTRTYTDCSMTPDSYYAYSVDGMITDTATDNTSSPTPTVPITTITTTTIITTPTEETCWSWKYGYDCCPNGIDVAYENEDGVWGIDENGQWCGIIKETPTTTTPTTTTPIEETCWSLQYGYECCPSGIDVVYENEDGAWGIDDHHWCGIIKEAPSDEVCEEIVYVTVKEKEYVTEKEQVTVTVTVTEKK